MLNIKATEENTTCTGLPIQQALRYSSNARPKFPRPQFSWKVSSDSAVLTSHLVALLRLSGEQPSRQCRRLRRSSRPPPAALVGLPLVSCWRLLIKIRLGRNPLVPYRLKRERPT